MNEQISNYVVLLNTAILLSKLGFGFALCWLM